MVDCMIRVGILRFKLMGYLHYWGRLWFLLIVSFKRPAADVVEENPG